jgi:hypothetical protein
VRMWSTACSHGCGLRPLQPCRCYVAPASCQPLALPSLLPIMLYLTGVQWGLQLQTAVRPCTALSNLWKPDAEVWCGSACPEWVRPRRPPVQRALTCLLTLGLHVSGLPRGWSLVPAGEL